MRQRPGAVRHPDRARRLPEHRRPGGAGRPPLPAARPGARLLTEIPGVTCFKPQAALYLFPRFDPQLYPIADDQQFILELLNEEKVLLVQGTGFNWPDTNHLRVVFLPNVDDLTEAIGRIARFLQGYRKRHGTLSRPAR